jgi:hypothetical protein
MKRSKIRPIVEILSIMILFYTNLLMGQFLRTSSAVTGQSIWAIIINIVTLQNIVIGLVGATIAYFIVEWVTQK